MHASLLGTECGRYPARQDEGGMYPGQFTAANVSLEGQGILSHYRFDLFSGCDLEGIALGCS